MKLIELAKEYNLEPDLLREVVEEDLSIPLPKGMESELKDAQVQRILASDGLEMVGGQAFKPIIAKVFPLARAREAFEFGAASHSPGKIVLEVKPVATDIRPG